MRNGYQQSLAYLPIPPQTQNIAPMAVQVIIAKGDVIPETGYCSISMYHHAQFLSNHN
jgi:hypothetical protein